MHGKPTVGMMHDTIVQHYADHHPQTRSRAAFRYWIDATRRSLQTLDRVMTVSQYSALQLQSFCHRYGIDPPPIDVTFEGSQWESLIDHDFEKQPRVIHLASKAIHKRTNAMLRLWGELGRRRVLPELMLVGSLDAEGESIVVGLQNIVRMPSQSLQSLQALVGGSRVLLLPSEIEGFGLPALEAYYCKTAVAYTGGSSIDEVVGDDGVNGCFQIDDVASFSAALDWAWNLSHERRTAMAHDRHDRFAMDRMARRVAHSFATAAGTAIGTTPNWGSRDTPSRDPIGERTDYDDDVVEPATK